LARTTGRGRRSRVKKLPAGKRKKLRGAEHEGESLREGGKGFQLHSHIQIGGKGLLLLRRGNPGADRRWGGGNPEHFSATPVQLWSGRNVGSPPLGKTSLAHKRGTLHLGRRKTARKVCNQKKRELQGGKKFVEKKKRSRSKDPKKNIPSTNMKGIWRKKKKGGKSGASTVRGGGKKA